MQGSSRSAARARPPREDDRREVDGSALLELVSRCELTKLHEIEAEAAERDIELPDVLERALWGNTAAQSEVQEIQQRRRCSSSSAADAEIEPVAG